MSHDGKGPAIVMVAAAARGRAIGKDGKMPWHLPAELRHFRRATLGKPVIMGRKTFASIGKPLPGRTNIVLTRDPDAEICGAITAASLEQALEQAEAVARRDGAEEIVIAGGAEIYRQAMPLADRIVLTEIDLDTEADAFFPAIDPALWREVGRMPFPAESGHPAYTIVTYARQGKRSLEKESLMEIELKRVDPERWERIKRAHPGLPSDLDVVPKRHSDKAAGCDLIACIDEPVAFAVGGRPVLIPTGIAIHIGEAGVDAELHPRSGLATKFGLVLANLTGVVDADYQGQIMVGLVRLHPGTEGGETVVVNPGDRIAQLVLKRVVRAEWRIVESFAETTARGAGGFGSTGIGQAR